MWRQKIRKIISNLFKESNRYKLERLQFARGLHQKVKNALGYVDYYIYCRNESKIGEILKYLYEQEIPFEIIGRQALFLKAVQEEEIEEFLNDDWFEVEKKDDINQFPPECWQFKRGKRSFLWAEPPPDKFSPVKIPEQVRRN